MALRRERWTKIEVPTKVEAPRKTYRLDKVFVSPGGLFVEATDELERGTQLTVSFSVEGKRGQSPCRIAQAPGSTRNRESGNRERQTGMGNASDSNGRRWIPDPGGAHQKNTP